MGFDLSSVIPLDFVDKKTRDPDWAAFREDLRGKLLTEHTGFINGVGTGDLAEYYFKRRDLEAYLRMEHELQTARFILMNRGIILKNSFNRWHIVATAIEAHSFLVNRTMRIVRAHERNVKANAIATDNYPELQKYSLPTAISAMGKPIKKLRQALNKDMDKVKRLTEGNKEA